MLRYLQQLGECRDTSEILELVLAQAIKMDLGIKTIRYYRLRRIRGTEHLVSVDCAGHRPYEATQLRLGMIAKVRRKPDAQRVDGSFDVFDPKRMRPVVFQINPELDIPIIERQSGPLPFFELTDDACDKWLGSGAARDPWVDVPLRLARRFLGKLSCSLDTGRIDLSAKLPKHLSAKLVRFQGVANYAAPFLESLRALDVNAPLEEASQAIFSCDTYDDLYKYCTEELLKKYPFDYEAADILVVSRDTLKGYEYLEDEDDSELLILRGSSFDLAKHGGWVDTRYYRKSPDKVRPWVAQSQPGEDGRGLTPWVWRERKSLLLNNQGADPEFARQLRAYDENLSWVHHIPGVMPDKHRSMLIVPIPAPPSKKDGERFRAGDAEPPDQPRIIGVIRFINKKGDYIEPREEVLLRRIAERCLGPKLMSLRYEMFAQKIGGNLDKVNLLRFEADEAAALGDAGPDLKQLIRRTLEIFLADLTGKLVLVNLLQRNGRFKPIFIGGGLGNDPQFHKEFELKGTLTGYVVERDRPWIFLNDLAYAARKGHYEPVAVGAKCALASAIRFGDDTFGALVLLSGKYDILPTSYGRLIHVIAGQIGLMLARQAAFEFASCIEELKHDGQHFIQPIRDVVETCRQERRPPTADEVALVNRKLDAWDDTIQTHCRTGPLPVEKFPDTCTPGIDVEETIRLAARDAWDVAHDTNTSPDEHLSVVVKPEGLPVTVNSAFLYIALFNPVPSLSCAVYAAFWP
jgi:hypothetical protein